jgi:hypothetical protein
VVEQIRFSLQVLRLVMDAKLQLGRRTISIWVAAVLAETLLVILTTQFTHNPAPLKESTAKIYSAVFSAAAWWCWA